MARVVDAGDRLAKAKEEFGQVSSETEKMRHEIATHADDITGLDAFIAENED